MSRQLISSDEAVHAERQHKTPCSDCPFARTALRGWLGSMTKEQWLAAAHGESLVDCHALIGAQCAGIAIYRANVAKLCISKQIIRLEPDKKKVFATPMEFMAHHAGKIKFKKEVLTKLQSIAYKDANESRPT